MFYGRMRERSSQSRALAGFKRLAVQPGKRHRPQARFRSLQACCTSERSPGTIQFRPCIDIHKVSSRAYRQQDVAFVDSTHSHGVKRGTKSAVVSAKFALKGMVSKCSICHLIAFTDRQLQLVNSCGALTGQSQADCRVIATGPFTSRVSSQSRLILRLGSIPHELLAGKLGLSLMQGHQHPTHHQL